MSIPTAVFLDTSVLDGQNYNYASTVLSTFLPACKNRKLKLLLPDPTEREIRRHIEQRSHEALAALEDASRKAPFLAKWKGFPKDVGPNWEVHYTATAEWHSFINQFDVVRLGFETVNMRTIMNWYDRMEPPFGTGKKRKEFPDAFAIAMLAHYAEKHEVYIAVVSGDKDWKAACDRFPSLLHFRSLPVLTELLLSEGNSRVTAVRAALDAALETITTEAYENAIDDGVEFYYSTFEPGTLDRTDIEDLEITDMQIVALGEHECTITFDGVVKAKHHFEWDDIGPDGESHIHYDRVDTAYDVSGTAKLSLDPNSNAVVSIPFITLNEGQIEVTDMPYWTRRW